MSLGPYCGNRFQITSYANLLHLLLRDHCWAKIIRIKSSVWVKNVHLPVVPQTRSQDKIDFQLCSSLSKQLQFPNEHSHSLLEKHHINNSWSRSTGSKRTLQTNKLPSITYPPIAAHSRPLETTLPECIPPYTAGPRFMRVPKTTPSDPSITTDISEANNNVLFTTVLQFNSCI